MAAGIGKTPGPPALRVPAEETTDMPTVSYALDEEHVLDEKDVAKLAAKVKGKTLTIKLTERDMAGDKIKPGLKWKVEFDHWIKGFGLSPKGYKLFTDEAELDGKITAPGDYDLVVTANRQRCKATLEVIAPVVAAAPEPKYSFANAKVKALCGADEMKKIVSIALAGKGETGHGPVAYLDGALHAHVTNTAGIAWKWKGDEVHVVAWGKKNNQNKEQARGGKGKKLKTCQYDWDEG